MKLKECFITHRTGDQQILLSTDTKIFSGLIRSNPTAAFIVDMLKKETTKEAVLEAMKQKYRGDEALMAEDIDMVIKTLLKIRALDE